MVTTIIKMMMMKGSFVWLGLLASTLLVTANTAAAAAAAAPGAYHLTAFQTGPDARAGGSSFVSAVLYHPAADHLILTGSTTGYEFDDEDVYDVVPGAYRCFVAVLPLSMVRGGDANVNGYGVHDMNAPIPFEQRTTLGHLLLKKSSLQASSQTCSHATLRATDGHVLLAGHAGQDPGGILDSLYDRGSSILNTRYGTLFDLAPTNKLGGAPAAANAYALKGGAVLQQAAAVYPVGLTNHAATGNTIFVASMFTDSDEAGTDFFEHALDPNMVFPVGKTFGMTVEAYAKVVPVAAGGGAPNQEEQTDGPMQTADRIFVEFYAPYSGASVSVAGIVQVSPEVLVVAGHTAGQGPSFGTDVQTAGSIDQDSPTMDGFVTKLRTSNGKLFSKPNSPPSEWNSVLRIQSMDHGNENIHGICHDTSSVADPDFVYIVGSTTGNMERAELGKPNPNIQRQHEAFLIKVQLSTMQTVWETQIGTGQLESGVRGISCTVTADGHDVWWAGHVENDGLLPGTGIPEPFGKIDIFIAKVNAETGTPQFVRQFGSQEDDLLANRGGVTTDAAGNAIVVGNTFGSLYRQKMEGTDTASVFCMTVNRADGDLVPNFKSPHFEPPPGSSSSSSSGVPPPSGGNANPVPPPPSSTNPFDPNPTSGTGSGAPPPAPVPVPTNNADDAAPTTISVKDSNDKLKNMEKWVALLLILFILSAAIMFLAYYAGYALNRDAATTDRAKVLQYLNNFDVEDVDLKHSATGGWHCSYANGLAQGEVRRLPSLAAGPSPSVFDDSPGGDGEPLGGGGGGRSGLLRDPLTAPLNAGSDAGNNSNSRIVKDSLFMDDEDAMEYGGRSPGGGIGGGMGSSSPLHGRGGEADAAGYDGLIDAYNNTWEDRRPLSSPEKKSGGNKKSSSGGKRRSGSKRSSLSSSKDDEPTWGRGIV